MPGYALLNKLTVRLNIGGYEVPLGPSALHQLTITQNSRSLTPEASLSFLDFGGGLIDSGCITDGCTVIIGMGNDGQTLNNSNFIWHTLDEVTMGQGGYNINATAVMSPQMLRKVATQYVKGNSSDVMSQYAGLLGLGADVDQTNDMMAWIPANKSFGQFLRHVRDHGYLDGQSHMALGIATRGLGDWTLRYKNTTSQLQAASVATFTSSGYENPGDYTLGEIEGSNISGLTGSHAGYGSQIIQNSSQGINDLFSQILASFSSGSGMPFSSGITGAMQLARREFFPQDMANTHNNYADAKNQNRKLLSTFTQYLSVSTPNYTNVQLFDPITVNFIVDGASVPYFSGNYICSARVQSVSGNSYMEKVQLTRQQASSSPAGTAFSGVPANSSIANLINQIF